MSMMKRRTVAHVDKEYDALLEQAIQESQELKVELKDVQDQNIQYGIRLNEQNVRLKELLVQNKEIAAQNKEIAAQNKVLLAQNKGQRLQIEGLLLENEGLRGENDEKQARVEDLKKRLERQEAIFAELKALKAEAKLLNAKRQKECKEIRKSAETLGNGDIRVGARLISPEVLAAHVRTCEELRAVRKQELYLLDIVESPPLLKKITPLGLYLDIIASSQERLNIRHRDVDEDALQAVRDSIISDNFLEA